MALKPKPKVIADELFERWLRRPGTLELLNTALNKISKGETPIDVLLASVASPSPADGVSAINSRNSAVGLAAPPKGTSSPAAANSPRRQVFTEQTNIKVSKTHVTFIYLEVEPGAVNRFVDEEQGVEWNNTA